MAVDITITGQKEMADNIKRLSVKISDGAIRVLSEVADEMLRLSQKEVPHDVGTLQNTGHSEPKDDEVIVGYNTPYAARLHEHPEYRFRKGRKGKYLEDPIKNNLDFFLKFMGNKLKGLL